MTFALIDGNAFYCSCERVFDLELGGTAVFGTSTQAPGSPRRPFSRSKTPLRRNGCAHSLKGVA